MVFTTFVGCTNNQPTTEPETKQAEEHQSQPETKQEPEKEQQTFTYNMGADPETLDPNKATENVGFTVLANTFEGLTRLGDKDEPIPAVAEKWDISEDGTKYKFYLREDAKWSDGKTVTAYDFEYSWKRAVDPETASDYAYMLYYIKNAEKINNGELPVDDLAVKVIDERTIEVTLEGPCSWMLTMFAFATYSPVRQDIIENDPETWALNFENLVTNGPFFVDSWRHNDRLRLLPNEHYWDKQRVKLDEVTITLINEESTALGAFDAGDVDAVDGVPVAEIPRLLAEEPDFYILPALGTYYYVFNNTAQPFDNEDIRKAFALAIDRRAIVETVTLGGQVPATGFVPFGMRVIGKDFRKEGKDYGIDPNAALVEEAKELLAKAGYPDGEGFPEVTLKYNTTEAHKRIAEAIQEMWKKNLNIDVNLENTEWRVHLNNLDNGNFQVGRIGWSSDYSHPMSFLDMWISGSGNNYAQWKSTELDDYIKTAKTTPSEEEAVDSLHKAEDVLMERMTIMPIYYNTEPELVKGYVKNWRKSVLGYMFFDEAYIEGK